MQVSVCILCYIVVHDYELDKCAVLGAFIIYMHNVTLPLNDTV